MFLFVGLGNPGVDYQKHRHNYGFMVLDFFCKNNNLKNWKAKMNGFYVKTILEGKDVIFLKPQSYMNLSGKVVADFVNFFKIKIENILVIYDDLAIEFGNFVLKNSGGSAGHNGVKNIINFLQTEKFSRLKLGIKNSFFASNRNLLIKNFVMQNFSHLEFQELEKIFLRVEKFIIFFIKFGKEKAANEFNKKV